VRRYGCEYQCYEAGEHADDGWTVRKEGMGRTTRQDVIGIGEK